MTKQIESVTVKQLRDALAMLGAGHDNAPVEVWLPGSRIALVLANSLIVGRDEVLIEGNVKPGSTLYQE